MAHTEHQQRHPPPRPCDPARHDGGAARHPHRARSQLPQSPTGHHVIADAPPRSSPTPHPGHRRRPTQVIADAPPRSSPMPHPQPDLTAGPPPEEPRQPDPSGSRHTARSSHTATHPRPPPPTARHNEREAEQPRRACASAHPHRHQPRHAFQAVPGRARHRIDDRPRGHPQHGCRNPHQDDNGQPATHLRPPSRRPPGAVTPTRTTTESPRRTRLDHRPPRPAVGCGRLRPGRVSRRPPVRPENPVPGTPGPRNPQNPRNSPRTHVSPRATPSGRSWRR